MKLQEGDRVRLTREGEDTFPMRQVKTGAVIDVAQQTVNVLVDGENKPTRWHKDFWQKEQP